MYKYLPAHVNGRHFEIFKDPQSTLSSMNINVGGYVRTSTLKDEQLTSIDYQKKLLHEWALINRYNLVKIYTDQRSGAFAYQRDGLSEVLQDIQAGKIKGVIIKEISRSSRDIQDVLSIKRKIVHYGGFLIAITEGYDSRRDPDEFLLTLHAALGQKEMKNTAGRVKLTQMIKARAGKTNVPSPAFGYMLSPDKQTLEPNPETAPILRLIFERYLDGWGQLKIAKHLNAKGIMTSRGKKWSTNAIRTIISNPVYVGCTMYNMTTLIRDPSGTKQRVIRPEEDWIIKEGTHEPLISNKIFEKVQAIMKAKKEKDIKEWSCDRKYIGSGILFCAECNGKIYGSRYKKKYKDKKIDQYYYRYRCDGRNGRCGSIKYWNMDEVDNKLLDVFQLLFRDEEKLNDAIKNQLNCEETNPMLQIEKEHINIRLEGIEKAMKRQQAAYENDAIQLAEYRQRMNELREEKISCQEKLGKITDKLSKTEGLSGRLNVITNKVKGILSNLKDLTKEEKTELLNSTFEKVYLIDDYSIDNVIFRCR